LIKLAVLAVLETGQCHLVHRLVKTFQLFFSKKDPGQFAVAEFVEMAFVVLGVVDIQFDIGYMLIIQVLLGSVARGAVVCCEQSDLVWRGATP